MKLFRSPNDIPAGFRAEAVSIGNFDGVHRGHAKLVERLVARARPNGGPAVIFTFDPHPVRLLRPEQAPPPLTWTERKAELLAALGVDVVLAYPTDEQLLGLGPEEFFERFVVELLGARHVIEGPNFYFGRNRSGDIRLLESLCRARGIPLEIVPPLELDGQMVSSSRIRRAIARGDVELARQMMTEPYRLRGMVTHGAQRGARLGFPTANLEAIDTLMPAAGVYAGRGWVGGRCWPAAIHIGPNPTFSEEILKVEVHLIDYQGNLYNQPLEVDFLSRLRDIRTFSSIDELQRQLELDVLASRSVAEADSSPAPRLGASNRS